MKHCIIGNDKRCRLHCLYLLDPRPRNAPGALERLHCLFYPLTTEDAYPPAECNSSKAPSRVQVQVALLAQIRPSTHQWRMPAYSRVPITQRWRFWIKHLRFMYSQATPRSYTKARAVLRWDHPLKRGKVKGGFLKQTSPTSQGKTV